VTEGIARAPEAWQTTIKKLGAKNQRAHTRRRDHGERVVAGARGEGQHCGRDPRSGRDELAATVSSFALPHDSVSEGRARTFIGHTGEFIARGNDRRSTAARFDDGMVMVNHRIGM
jgi:hypothetical protein